MPLPSMIIIPNLCSRVPDMAEAAAGCVREARLQALWLQQAAESRAKQP